MLNHDLIELLRTFSQEESKKLQEFPELTLFQPQQETAQTL